MSVVAFDNTMLSILLNPMGNIPADPATGKPVEFAKERAEGLVVLLQKRRSKVILPTPACAELLTAIGPDAQQYINLVGRSRIFEIAAFDAKCAAELAILNRSTFWDGDEKNGLEPYQKIKIDRQIVAICKASGVSEIYTDDTGLSKRAHLCGITPIGIAALDIPDTARQGNLDLELHTDIPQADDETRAEETTG